MRKWIVVLLSLSSLSLFASVNIQTKKYYQESLRVLELTALVGDIKNFEAHFNRQLISLSFHNNEKLLRLYLKELKQTAFEGFMINRSAGHLRIIEFMDRQEIQHEKGIKFNGVGELKLSFLFEENNDSISGNILNNNRTPQGQCTI